MTGEICHTPSEQFFSHVGTIFSLPGLNPCLAANKVTCSRTQHSDFDEPQTLIPSLKLYQLSLCTLQKKCLETEIGHCRDKASIIQSTYVQIQRNEGPR